MQVKVKLSAGALHTLEVAPSLTVAELKELLATAASIPVAQQRLVHKGRVLQDAKTLQEYGVEAEHTLHCVRSPSASSPPPSAAPAVASLGADGAAGGMFGGGFPGGDESAIMQQMLNAPGMASMMESLMSNGDVIRSLLSSNPAMRDLLERNPEMAHVLNDPSVLRQAMEMARNPNLLREQMRSHDRALSNLDVSPEGFNALRRAYTDVQAPLLDAAAAPPPAPPANPFASLFSAAPPPAAAPSAGGINASPLPNPWAPAALATTAPPQALGGDVPLGLGGMGLGSMGGMGGMDPAQMEAMLSSPAIAAALEHMAANPAMMEAMMAMHPGLQTTLSANPALRSMLTNPAALRAMADPANLRAMAQMQQLMGQMQGGGLGFGSMTPLSGLAQPVPPTQLYATQLAQMADMGFSDAEANVRALQATGGNVNAAVERLLSGPTPP